MLTALPTASIIRAALWGFGQLFPFSEFFDNPGQSLIQSAKYLLSWFRKGRYQCPPRKEPPDTRFATSPTRHRIARCERSVRAVRLPETQVSIVSIALRDQLIHNILVWRAVQRESLTRQGSKAGKIRVRTGRETTTSVESQRERGKFPSYIRVLKGKAVCSTSVKDGSSLFLSHSSRVPFEGIRQRLSNGLLSKWAAADCAAVPHWPCRHPLGTVPLETLSVCATLSFVTLRYHAHPQMEAAVL